MIKPASDPAFPWTGIFFGAPILGIWYWCTDQMIVQRVLGAKNETHARGGALLCGAAEDHSPSSCSCFRASSPGRSTPTSPATKPTRRWSCGCCRPGSTGFMVAALMAALMSSLAATFNSASTLVTFDVYKVLRPSAAETQLVRVGRIVTVVHGRAQHAVGAVHQVPELRGLHLPPERAGVHQPADCRGVSRRRVLAARQPQRRDRGAAGGRRSRRGALHLRAEPRTPALVSGSPFLSALVGINFLHFAILLFVISVVILVVVSLATSARAAREAAAA